MQITEIKIVPSQSNDGRLLAYCSVVFDGVFIVRDLRIIRKNNSIFVAMPSRRSVTECGRCRGKNSLGVPFCNHCGTDLTTQKVVEPAEGFTDIAHPITQSFRVQLEQEVIKEYRSKILKAG